MIKKIIVLALSLMMSVASFGCGGEKNKTTNGGIVMNETFFNPLRVEQGLGDPWMYKHGDEYYYMHSEGTQITVTRSRSMTQITPKYGDESVTKIIARQKAMNLVELWAPEIFYFENHWYVYFTATTEFATEIEKDTNRRTYVLKSKTSDAFGEWNDVKEIMLPMDYRSIDATFMNYNGRQYIIWSGWPYSGMTDNWKQNLYITELVTGDPTTAKSTQDSARVLISEPIYDWENSNANQNEGPSVMFAPDGTPIVIYAGNFSGSDLYCIGYVKLEGTDPMRAEKWHKADKPLMQTDMEYAEVIAPGHASVVKSPNGSEDWICYHAAKVSGSGWDRMTRLQKLTWDGNTPKVERIDRFSDAIALPSGEKVNRRRFEAESATLSPTAITVESTGEDANGKEFNYASGGKAVQLSEQTDSVTFKVEVPSNGEYLLSVRFSNTSVGSTGINVSINGEKKTLFAPKTQYLDSFIQNSMYVEMFVRKDNPNIVEITCDKNILIDCIVVDYLGRK